MQGNKTSRRLGLTAAAALRRAIIEPLEARQLLSGDASVVHAIPYSLDFSAAASGIADAQGQGTGFSWVQPNKNGNEYQPGLINLDTSKALLQLTTTGTSAAGGPWEGDNTQVNALQTEFDATNGTFTVSTRLVGPLTTFSAPTEQAGLIVGPDQDNYIKLVAGDFANGQFLQFADEQKAAGATGFTHAIDPSNSYTSIGSFANIQTLDLEISGNSTTGVLSGFYRINGGAVQPLAQTVTLSGAERSAFFNSMARAGIMTMAKNDLAPVTASFGNFAIKPGTPAAQLPHVTYATPASGASSVDVSAFVSCDLGLPNAALNAKTLNSSTVYLYQTANKLRIPAVVNTTGGGDAIILTPSVELDPNTQYTFVATSGVKDLSGAALVPFQMNFTTGSAGGIIDNSIAFKKVALSNTAGIPFTCVRVGPDGKLYASAEDGRIFRYPINADGTLGTPLVSTALQSANGAKRLVSGFAFDPASTTSNVTLWICNSYFAVNNVPDWTGKISVMSGSNLQTVQDAVINLPRAYLDHLNEQPAFGPDGALYFCQGSNTAMGAPDVVWGNRPEHLLNGAILRLDISKITPGQPLDAKTDSGGTYNPYAAGAPLTLYATGVRNAFDIVWTHDGKLYAPTNGSAAGGNAPSYTAGDPNQVNGNRIDTGKPYSGPNVPSLTNISVAEDDYVYNIVPGGYYGHPNPLRGEFVLDGGNPTSKVDPGEVADYPVGTQPDVNYRSNNAYDLGAHRSPDGVIEYQSSAFGGALNNDLLIAEYSGGSDIAIVTRNAQGNITGTQRGVTGLTNFNNPVNLCQDPATGNIYVAELGGQKLTLLVPATVVDATPPAPPGGLVGVGSAGGVTLTWGPNSESDVAGYNVYASDSASGPFVKINNAVLVSPNFTDATAPVGTIRYYEVTAVDGSGNESADSAPAGVMRPNPTAPAAPAGINIAGSLDGTTISWNADTEPDLAGYNIYRSDLPNGPFVQINAKLLKQTSYADTTAPAGATSYYQITAINTSGKESGTSQLSSAFRPDATPPAAPISLEVVNASHGVAISWAASPETDVAGYNVYRYAKKTGWTRINANPVTAASLNDATKKARSAKYVVSAIDTSGNESALSEISSKPIYAKILKKLKKQQRLLLKQQHQAEKQARRHQQ